MFSIKLEMGKFEIHVVSNILHHYLFDFVNIYSDIWMFPKIGGFYPPKWMVKIMVPNPMNKFG